MKKLTATILSVVTLSACLFSGTALFRAQNKTAFATGDQTVTLSATQQTKAAKQNAKSAQTEQTRLLMPDSYEEYLDLNAPTDVAVNDKYTAIADGNVIYVYDRAFGVYREYQHSVNTDPLKNIVTKLQFDDDGNLYFLDATYLYILKTSDLGSETLQVKNTSFPCTTFYLHKDTLYYTDTKQSSAQLSKIDIGLHDIDVTYAETLKTGLNGKPTITVYNNELYCTNGNVLTKYDEETDKLRTLAVFDDFASLQSIAIVGNLFCCTNDAQNFYAYNMTDLTKAMSVSDDTIAPLNRTQGNFTALSVYNGEVYAVDGNVVRNFDASSRDYQFSNYEISNHSSSVHRLSDAAETCLVGDTLLIADNGNRRISVMNTATRTFSDPIPNTLTAKYLASDGNTLVVADDDGRAILYSLRQKDYGAALAEFKSFNGKIKGVACVYGTYYFITNNYRHYRATLSLTDEGNEVWTCDEVQRAIKRETFLLASDAYGDLYVASGNKIYRYTEAEFMNSDSEGELVYEGLSTVTKKLLVDFTGNLYALTDGKIQKLGEETPYDLNTPLVYADSATVRSFAFHVEKNAAYVLYEENYVAETEILELPTVKTIALHGADAEIFAEASATFSVVQTNPDALIIYFDIDELQGAEVFPYLSYERANQPFTALKIGETADYDVLACFDESTHAYNTCIVLKAQRRELPPEDYRFDYDEPQTGYLTNDVHLYKFPYLTRLLTVSRLQAGSQIQLLGEIDRLDHPYYQIAYTDENGEQQVGFVPKAYVTSFNGAPPVPETKTYGSTQNNNDSIFRLCYLILGAGVVCILADVLILRKRKDD